MFDSKIPKLMLIYTYLTGITQGMSTLWFFQGFERLEKFSYAEISVRIIYLASVFIFVKSDSDSYIVFLSLIINLGLLYTLSYVNIWRNYTRFTLSISYGLEVVKQSYTIASFSLITSIYSIASVFIYSLFAASFNVSLYGNGDRLIRATIAMMGPLNQIFAPKSAIIFSRSNIEGWRNFKRMLLFYGLLGAIVTIGLYFSGSFIAEVVFGSKYAYSGNVIRNLSILLFLVAINTAMTYHLLIPAGQSVVMNKVYILASLICGISICIMVPSYGITGMVFSVIIPEVFALLCMSVFIFKWRRLNVFSV